MNDQYYIQRLLYNKLKDLGDSAEVFIKANDVKTKELIDSVDEKNLTVKFKSKNTVKVDNGTITYTQNGNPIMITMDDIETGSLNIGLQNVNGTFMGIAFGGRKSKRRSRRPKRKRSRRYKIK
jgi:hypothetical protein